MSNIPALRATVAEMAAQKAFQGQITAEKHHKAFVKSAASKCQVGQRKVAYMGWMGRKHWKCTECLPGHAQSKVAASDRCDACEFGRFALYRGSAHCTAPTQHGTWVDSRDESTERC